MNKKIFDAVCGDIIKILEKDSVELKHANDVLKWLLVIKPKANYLLKIAAFGHDIERAHNKIDFQKFKTHYLYKTAHAKRSSSILARILTKNNAASKDIRKICVLVENHEFGGKGANAIRDADSLANFIWCDNMFGKKDSDSLKSTMERMYFRMSKRNRKFIEKISFKNKPLDKFLFEIRKDKFR